jgi:hypothetical protein
MEMLRDYNRYPSTNRIFTHTALQAVDAMLRGKKGISLIDYVWTIVLFHADFNYLNKFVG